MMKNHGLKLLRTASAVCLALAVVSASVSAQQRDALVSSLPYGVEMEFVRIPAGEFMMGCSPGDNQCSDDEKPRHTVRITHAFEMAKYEVTEAQWQAVMVSNPFIPAQGEDYAYGLVGWVTAQEFIDRLNALNDGYTYRLPTEAEWEYAARAGSIQAYPTSPLNEVAWYGQNAAGKPYRVGQKRPNRWGLYDMQGNVWEWVSDFYDENYYTGSPMTDPKGPANGQYHVLRGGSLFSDAPHTRVSARSFVGLPVQMDFFGFRCVRETNR